MRTCKVDVARKIFTTCNSLIAIQSSNANTLATQTELDTTQASVGLDANGDLPNYISTHYIQNGDTHHTALGKLDVQANNNHSDIIDIANALAGKLESVDFNATNIKLIVNADNVGLNADTVDGVHGTNITNISKG